MDDINKILKDLKSDLSTTRYQHTLGVAESSVELADQYGEDKYLAYLAGILHDIAKELSLKDMQKWVSQTNWQIDDMVWSSRALLHGPAGAAIAKLKYGIEDEKVLHSIFYHTFARKGMTLLEKIVFLADYIEPRRAFPAVEKIRKLAKKDLDLALLEAINSSIRYLVENNEIIYLPTIAVRNELICKSKRKK